MGNVSVPSPFAATKVRKERISASTGPSGIVFETFAKAFIEALIPEFSASLNRR